MEPLFLTHQIIPGLANPNLASPPRKKLRQKLDFSSPPQRNTTPIPRSSSQHRNHEWPSDQQDCAQQPVEAEPVRAGDQHCWCSVRPRDQHVRSQERAAAPAVRLCPRGENPLNLEIYRIHTDLRGISRCPYEILFHRVREGKGKSTFESSARRTRRAFSKIGIIDGNFWTASRGGPGCFGASRLRARWP